MVAQVVVVGLDVAVAKLDVSLERVGESGQAEKLGVLIAVGDGR